MREGDQAVDLASAIGGIETEDRSDLATGPGEPSADVSEQALEPSCRVGVGEEPCRVPVFGASLAGDHRGQIGCEVRFRNLAPEHVVPWCASVDTVGIVIVFVPNSVGVRSGQRILLGRGRVCGRDVGSTVHLHRLYIFLGFFNVDRPTIKPIRSR